MKIDQKILNEISRYRDINKYIMEQVPPPEGGAIPPEGGAIPPEGGAIPPPLPPAGGDAQVVDTTTDPDVEEIGGDETKSSDDSETEEIDITDLIDSQKTMSDKQEEYFNNLFSQLETLQTKLGEMDKIAEKLNSVEDKIDRYRPKTPEEKLELRSLDSGPFKQKLSDFFDDKLPEMEKSGKNEYILTSDDVENYNSSDIEQSFNDEIDDTNKDSYYK